jgi:hypothetical protein
MSVYISTDGDSFEVQHLDRGYGGGPPRAALRVNGRSGDIEVNGTLRLNGVAMTAGGGPIARYDSFTPTTGQTDFVLSQLPTGPVDMYVNGAKQKLGDDYTVSNKNVTWLDAGFTLDTTDAVEFQYT